MFSGIGRSFCVGFCGHFEWDLPVTLSGILHLLTVVTILLLGSSVNG